MFHYELMHEECTHTCCSLLCAFVSFDSSSFEQPDCHLYYSTLVYVTIVTRYRIFFIEHGKNPIELCIGSSRNTGNVYIY